MATLTANGGVLAQVTRQTIDGQCIRTYHRALTASGWILERWSFSDVLSKHSWPWKRRARLRDKAKPTPELVEKWTAQYLAQGWILETPRLSTEV